MVELLIITAIVCYIVDFSGFVDSIKYSIWRWVFNGKREYQEFNLKPFDCSLCLSFWIGLIYILCVGQFNIPMIGYVCLLSMLSGIISKMMRMVVIMLEWSVDKILSILE